MSWSQHDPSCLPVHEAGDGIDWFSRGEVPGPLTPMDGASSQPAAETRSFLGPPLPPVHPASGQQRKVAIVWLASPAEADYGGKRVAQSGRGQPRPDHARRVAGRRKLGDQRQAHGRE